MFLCMTSSLQVIMHMCLMTALQSTWFIMSHCCAQWPGWDNFIAFGSNSSDTEYRSLSAPPPVSDFSLEFSCAASFRYIVPVTVNWMVSILRSVHVYS